ncbi:MAG: hypothetical protein M0C28_17620 [Candidatus Moduliflexus flocculans]|nr:hypothetical protein [Candidatus Moduliflexus flocculans]
MKTGPKPRRHYTGLRPVCTNGHRRPPRPAASTVAGTDECRQSAWCSTGAVAGISEDPHRQFRRREYSSHLRLTQATSMAVCRPTSVRRSARPVPHKC